MLSRSLSKKPAPPIAGTWCKKQTLVAMKQPNATRPRHFADEQFVPKSVALRFSAGTSWMHEVERGGRGGRNLKSVSQYGRFWQPHRGSHLTRGSGMPPLGTHPPHKITCGKSGKKIERLERRHEEGLGFGNVISMVHDTPSPFPPGAIIPRPQTVAVAAAAASAALGVIYWQSLPRDEHKRCQMERFPQVAQKVGCQIHDWM